VATKTGSLAPTNSTAAAIQAWTTWIASGIVEVGWVQTSDTGQCNTATLSTPGAIQTSVGYQIFRMADALQATAPVFMKVEFGSGAAVNNPSLWITIGTGSDGAGNLTGIRMARSQLTSTASTISYACYMSGASGRLAIALWVVVNTSMAIIVERTHDVAGADTGDGLTVNLLFGSTKTSQYLPSSGTIPTAYANWNVITPPSGNGALSPNVYFFPIRCWSPGETFPILGAIAYVAGDFANDGTYLVQGFDGGNRTYIALGNRLTVVGYGGTSNCIAMRYD